MRGIPRLSAIMEASLDMAIAFGASEQDIVEGLSEDFDESFIGQRLKGFLGSRIKSDVKAAIAEYVHSKINN
jgi:hypothetical protein